jgi:hypothetical protein
MLESRWVSGVIRDADAVINRRNERDTNTVAGSEQGRMFDDRPANGLHRNPTGFTPAGFPFALFPGEQRSPSASGILQITGQGHGGRAPLAKWRIGYEYQL